MGLDPSSACPTRRRAPGDNAQIRHAVGIAGARLTFESARAAALPAHEVYFGLAEACMAPDPADRPTFPDIHSVRSWPCPCRRRRLCPALPGRSPVTAAKAACMRIRSHRRQLGGKLADVQLFAQ